MVFFMVRAIPGDPAQILLGQNATQEQIQALTAKMGLDKPILVQYGLFLKDAASGDVYIQDVPMVDQGQKGYCAVACTERVVL